RQLFRLIHRREQLPTGQFQWQLEAARDGVLAAGATHGPRSRDAQAVGKRARAHGGQYFTFVATPGGEATKNLAEQASRLVVIDRHLTQGTRGEAGQRWSERIWTVMATCAQQGRSVFDYLCAAVAGHFQGGAVPSLLAEG